MMNKNKKHSSIYLIIITTIIIMALIIVLNWPVIFQKGNPIPYLKGIIQLNDNQTYIHVQDDNQIVFITKRDDYDEFHKYIRDNYDVSFNEQMGSGYIFRSNEKDVIVTSEVYWKYYVIWSISIKEK